MLTPRQAELLEFLNTELATTGVCPTYDDMRAAMASGNGRILQSDPYA
jgi:hypothetical protein